MSAHELYAEVKPRNRLAYHNQLARTRPYGCPFPVTIDTRLVQDDVDQGCVKGGPGGQYRLKDVNLFVKSHDGRRFFKIN